MTLGLGVVVSGLLAGPAAAQSADEILRTAARMAEERMRSVENYTIRQQMGPVGNAPVYFVLSALEVRA